MELSEFEIGKEFYVYESEDFIFNL